MISYGKATKDHTNDIDNLSLEELMQLRESILEAKQNLTYYIEESDDDDDDVDLDLGDWNGDDADGTDEEEDDDDDGSEDTEDSEQDEDENQAVDEEGDTE